MDKFKIKIKEFIIIIAISIPIGIFIFIFNYNKINYNIKFRVGSAVAENFCENYSDIKIPLIGWGDIDVIYDKYNGNTRNWRFESTGIRGEGGRLKQDKFLYEVSFKGDRGAENEIIDISHQMLKDIEALELANYNKFYKNIKLHCRSGEYSVFKLQPIEIVNINGKFKRTYKKTFLYLFAIQPLILMYLLLISFNYIRYIKNNFRR